MNIGDEVVHNEINKSCEIWKIKRDHDDNEVYDVLLAERNVPFESLYVPLLLGDKEGKIKEGETVLYKRHNNINEALIILVDHPSQSAQIRIIERDLYLV